VDSSSESTENSEHKRYLTKHWKELKANKAVAANANRPPSVETVSSTESKSIESPPRNRNSKRTSNAPEDWKTLDEESATPTPGNIEQPSPLRANAPSFMPRSSEAKAAKTSPSVSSSDYVFDITNCPVTAILHESHHRIANFLANGHNNNPSFLSSPDQSPFQVNYDDGEFIVINRTGSQVATLPEFITDTFPTDQAHSLDSPDLTSNEASNRGSPSADSTTSRQRRKMRRQQPGSIPVPKRGSRSNDSWLEDVKHLPPATLQLLYEQVLFDNPRREIIETSSTGISDINYQCSLERYQNGKPLSASSPHSKKDAKDKLFGFLLAQLGGLQPSVRYCKISQSHRISSNFKHYVSTLGNTCRNLLLQNPKWI
jgi:hypothetical protein